MKKITLIFILILAVAGCSSTSSKRSMGEVIDDSVISNKVKVKYLKDKTVKGLKVNVDTWKGIVTLHGRVDSQEQVDRAIVIAERQPGVKEVKSYLAVAGMSSPEVMVSEESPSKTTKKAKRKGRVVEKDLNEVSDNPDDTAKVIGN